MKRFQGNWGMRVVLLGVVATLVSACNEAGVTGPDPPTLHEVVPVWSQFITHRALARPLSADSERLYTSTPLGIVAIDPDQGAILWDAMPSPGLIGYAYELVGSVVVVITEERLVGLDAQTGATLWEQAIPSIVDLAQHGAAPIIATDGTTLYGLNPSTGVEVWSVPVEEGGFVNLSAGPGLACVERLVSAPSDARIACHRSEDGTHLWSRLIPSPESVAQVPGRVILVGAEGTVGRSWIGLDSDSGEPVWEFSELPELVERVPGPGLPVFGCGEVCAAVDASSGSVLWRSDPGTTGIPRHGTGFVFAVETDLSAGSLYILDASNGDVAATVTPLPGEAFCGSPATIGPRVFVYTCSGILQAYDVTYAANE